jgi:hypothetical protein
MSNSHELPDWFPDWAPAPPARRQEATATPTHDTPRWDLLTPPTGGSLRPTLSQETTPQPTPTGLALPRGRAPAISQTDASVSRVSAVTTEAEVESGFTYAAEIPIIVKPSQDRLVKRKLRGIHLFVSSKDSYVVIVLETFRAALGADPSDDVHPRAPHPSQISWC